MYGAEDAVLYASSAISAFCRIAILTHDGTAPAYEVVEPQIKVFTVGHSWSGFTKWQGNSPEVDTAWQELYNSESFIGAEDNK